MSRALISVSDKTDLLPLAQALCDSGVEIISTGGTKKFLDENGIHTISVESVTEFPEIMDGRVKTLHPKIHGGLLALRNNPDHQEALEVHDILPIDFVIVNLYPFKETIAKKDVSLAEAIENIDIGGPSMLRSAAKNYQAVTVVCDPADYDKVIEELEASQKTSLLTRQRLAQKVYAKTAAYDAMIANYLNSQLDDESHSENLLAEDRLDISLNHKETLRYGENAHQQAVLYEDEAAPAYSITKAKQLNGKALSYNNYRDADAALRMIAEFPNQPCAVAVKHLNPCGVAVGETIETAFERCFEADPISIFGGILVFNRRVSLKLAEQLHEIFLDIIIAPSFEEAALSLLKEKANVRLLSLEMNDLNMEDYELVSVLGGVLVQERDNIIENLAEWKTMTSHELTEKNRQALEFAWKVCKHVKSNAIVVANEFMTLGIGAGQTNRVASAKIAVEQAEKSGHDLSNMVMASDAFIPMTDTLEYAAKHQVQAIIQPAGSIKDQVVIERAEELGMPMLSTGVRHFRH